VSGEIHLLKGGDPVLLADAAKDLVDRLVGDAERGEVLEEFTGDDYDVGAVVLAASTVSMFGDRVVVARQLARLGTDDLAPLLEYLADPVPDAGLVLVWDRPTTAGARANPVPKKLSDAVRGAGGTVEDHGLPGGKGRAMWVDDQIDAAPVTLSAASKRLLVDRLGEDLNRLGGILEVLEATFGAGAGPLDPSDVEPFLGDAGGVPPWDLTDAIDGGRVAEAVTNVRRMLQGGGRHPLQVMVTLQTHFERMLRLDGAGVRDEKAAAALLGMKGSTFPAKKALAQTSALGSAKVARATQLLAVADVDLRGRTEASGEQVLEVLVARLAALSSRTGARRRR
jgi:DNA polymerase-3 subunit delta